MMKKTILSLLFTFALLLTASANDSIFVKLKSGRVLAYEYGENDTVSVNEKVIIIADTIFYSEAVSRITFDRSVLKQESGTQFVSFKLRGNEEINTDLLGKNFTADINDLTKADTIKFTIK